MIARVKRYSIGVGTPARSNFTVTLVFGFPSSESETCPNFHPRVDAASICVMWSPSMTPASSAGVWGNT